MIRIAAVLTSHNRCASTVAALTALVTSARKAGTTLEIFLADAASSDGTSDIVRESFPEAHVIHVGQDHYWAMGMRVAHSHAARVQPDAFLWLNDDTFLDGQAIAALIQTSLEGESPAIAVGLITDPDTGERTYGGWARSKGPWFGLTPIPSDGRTASCDTLNANAVLIPASVAGQLGGLDDRYTHALADLDYGFRASAIGIAVLQTPDVVGHCKKNARDGTWRDRKLSRGERFSALRSPTGLPPREWSYFLRRHGSWLWPVQLLSPILRICAEGQRSTAQAVSD